MENHIPNVAAILLLLLYILVKDLVFPLLIRHRNQKNNPGHVSQADFREFKSRMDTVWENQEKTNERFESNIRRIFERLDELAPGRRPQK